MIFDEGPAAGRTGCQPAVIPSHVRLSERQTKGLFWGEKRLNSTDWASGSMPQVRWPQFRKGSKIALAGVELTR